MAEGEFMVRSHQLHTNHDPVPAAPNGNRWCREPVSAEGQGNLGHTLMATPAGEQAMDDKDVRRLEDRIAAAQERSDLRLEAALGRIDAKFERMDARFDRMEATVADIKTDVRDLRGELGVVSHDQATRFGQLVGVIIGTGLAIAALVTGIQIGLHQFWGTGVQVGQTMQAPTGRTPPAGNQ